MKIKIIFTLIIGLLSLFFIITHFNYPQKYPVIYQSRNENTDDMEDVIINSVEITKETHSLLRLRVNYTLVAETFREDIEMGAYPIHDNSIFYHSPDYIYKGTHFAFIETWIKSETMKELNLNSYETDTMRIIVVVTDDNWFIKEFPYKKVWKAK